jgi:hypothetical protein
MEMKKMILLSLYFFAISFCPLMMGQDTTANYGYKLMPIRPLTSIENKLMLQHKFQPTNKLAKVASLPTVVDNTSLMPPVGDQGVEGSCTAFATAYAVGEVENMKAGAYSSSNIFSPAFLFNLETFYFNGQYGGSGPGVMSALKDAGCPKLADFPYIASTSNYELPSLEIMHKALPYSILDWHWIRVGDSVSYSVAAPGYDGINVVRGLLASGKPVILGVTLTGGYGSAMAAENWIYSYAVFGQQDYTGGHMLCIVGYNDSMQTKDGYGAFKVINSWGSNTFDNGYSWITYKFLAQKEYNEYFFTFTPRVGVYNPTLTVDIQLKNFGCTNGYFQTGLEYRGSTYTKKIWLYRDGIHDQTFFNHSVIDLTDLVGDSISLVPGAYFFIKGQFLSPSYWTANPEIVSLRIVDTILHLDTLINANLVIRPEDIKADPVFYNDSLWTGATWYFDPIITGIEDHPVVGPAAFSLFQNYPNPFNPTTVINFSLPKAGKVTLEVYDLLGRKITTLVSGYLTAGAHNTKFDASHLSSGVYVYRLQTDTFTATKKMVLMK